MSPAGVMRVAVANSNSTGPAYFEASSSSCAAPGASSSVGSSALSPVSTGVSTDPPASMAPFVVQAIQAACRTLGLENLPIVSRAYHDSLFMAGIAPSGMIFIPCKEGISHRPEEYSEPEAIARGVEVLALTLRELSKE